MTLAVELGTGFSDDEVTVLVDGQQVWRRAGVTTNYSVGIADIARIRAPAGSTVEARVRGTVRTWRIADEERLRLDIDPGGQLTLAPAPEGPIF
jgi:hypothetical protein